MSIRLMLATIGASVLDRQQHGGWEPRLLNHIHVRAIARSPGPGPSGLAGALAPECNLCCAAGQLQANCLHFGAPGADI